MYYIKKSFLVSLISSHVQFHIIPKIIGQRKQKNNISELHNLSL